ncbi:secondary thiamine-phosphate synthase enzyme YjbQ [Ruminococcus flavefaciens]|uniref:secondary thiamine-phosphate synthase enzyme YjbQ n=1 Tax=Ruminococcus flavefaciens TaxID=1265 RepID=UPI0015678B35|nr:secondary thiamine-phosphate synthase enzyme YjbQ [Ruminococcus flavefaciens]
MVFNFKLSTPAEGLVDITREVSEAVKESGVLEGICIIFCPHTTAAITINENADPDVRTDFIKGMDKFFPDLQSFRHAEGNSHAHIKSSAVGASETVIITGGKLLLGTWQDIYFCEFDGPRTRKFYVKVMGDR